MDFQRVSDKYWVCVSSGPLEHGVRYVEVAGQPASILPGFEFFSHESRGFPLGGYTVSVALTGQAIASGRTVEEATANARRQLESVAVQAELDKFIAIYGMYSPRYREATKSRFAGADWVKAHPGKPDVSPLGELVADLLGDMYAGIYHIERSLRKVDWSEQDCLSVTLPGGMATVDHDLLTRLVYLAHERALRVELEGVGPGYLRLTFWQRERGRRTVTECPSLREHIEDLDKVYGISQAVEDK